MENKPSKGVIIFAIYFVCISINDLIQNISKFNALSVLNCFTSSILLILFFNILRLKEWARKGLIYFNILMPLVVSLLLPYSYGLFLRQHQKEYSFISVGVCIIMVSILNSAVTIYFFTRPKVKEQFN